MKKRLQIKKDALLKMTSEEWEMLEAEYRHKDTRRGQRRYVVRDDIYDPYGDDDEDEE